MNPLSTELIVSAFGALAWGGALAFLPHLSISPTDLAADLRIVCRTATIHRGKALERMLNQHAGISVMEFESDETSIYTRTIQNTDALATAADTARALAGWCSFLRLTLYLTIAGTPVTLILGSLGNLSQPTALLTLLGIAILETLLGASLYVLAERIRRLANSPLILVGRP